MNKYFISYKSWAFSIPGEEGTNELIIVTYLLREKEWKVKGFTLSDLTDTIKPTDEGALYALNYFQANK